MADPLPSAKSRVTQASHQRIKSVVHVSLRTPSSFVFPKAKGGNVSDKSDRINSKKSAGSSQRSPSVTRVARSSSRSSKPHRIASNTGSEKSTRSNGQLTSAKVNPDEDDSKPYPPPVSNQQKRQSHDFLNDLTNPSHRNEKPKYWWKEVCRCSELRIGMCILLILIIMIVIAVVLALLLTKPKSKSIRTPSGAYLRWNTTGITLFGTSALRGNTSTQLWSPFGLIFDADGRLYIADRFNHRIKRCDVVQLTCSVIAGQANGARGLNSSDLSGPTYLYIDSNNRLYIADSDNQRVQLWTIGATSGQTLAGVTNVSGSASNLFKLPYGIVLDPSSSAMYVADYNNHRIMKYDSGASSGTLIAGGQGAGMNSSQLFRPAGLHFDSYTNSLVIANFGASNIVRWTLGGTQWTLVAGDANGSFGNTSTLLDHPTSMIFDPMGNMYVADMFNHRIRFFPYGQSSGTTIAGVSGVLGTNASTLYYPVAVALDNQLNLYVTDSFNQRVQKFLRY